VPEVGDPITYDLISMRITETPFDRISMRGHIIQSGFEITAKPYGRLPSTTVVTDANGTDPLLSFDVPPLPGTVDALGTLTLTDTATQARYHLEGGMESRYYDAGNPWDLFIDSADMTVLESSVVVATGTGYGGYSLRQTLSTTSKGVGFVTGGHVGRFHVKARVYNLGGASEDIDVRVGYSVRGSAVRLKDWVRFVDIGAWYELHLGNVMIDPISLGSHSVTWYIYAKSTTGTPQVYLDYIKLIPAERYWVASGSVGTVATVRAGRYARVQHDAILTETSDEVWARHPNAYGSYLRIPAEGGRIAVSLNRANLESAAHTPLGDAMRADLDVTPRVVLLGS
jgi:hypothetical protein